MIKWSKFATKAKFYASQGASKMGLGVKERFKLSMKVQKAKKKLSNKAFDIKKRVKKDIRFAKQYPELTAATVAIGGLTGLGVAGLVKSQKKKNGK